MAVSTAEAPRRRERAFCFQTSAPPRLCGEKGLRQLFHSFSRHGPHSTAATRLASARFSSPSRPLASPMRARGFETEGRGPTKQVRACFHLLLIVNGGRTADLQNRCATRWGETQENVAQGSLSSLAAFPPRRGLGGAAMGKSDYLVCGAARARPAGRAAEPERGPCIASS
jgi:hypothetical protein